MSIKLFKYNTSDVQSTEDLTVNDCFIERENTYNYWYDVIGATQEDLDVLTQHFGIHHLITEDILNRQGLPKIEVFDNYIFLSTKLLKVNNQNFTYEHVCFVMGDNYLISFQEVEGDVFDQMRNRILQNKGRVRRKQMDYLLIRLLNSIVNHYELELEELRGKIEELELKVIENKAGNLPALLIPIRHKIAELRRYVKAQEHAIEELFEDGIKHITSKNMVYLGDVQDSLRQLSSLFDVFRDLLASLMDLHLSNLSQNMNTVMKTLTVISSVFIPLTFLAGIYGMNFHHMPELAWEGAYPTLLISMVVITVSMVVYLKRKRWI